MNISEQRIVVHEVLGPGATVAIDFARRNDEEPQDLIVTSTIEGEHLILFTLGPDLADPDIESGPTILAGFLRTRDPVGMVRKIEQMAKAFGARWYSAVTTSTNDPESA